MAYTKSKEEQIIIARQSQIKTVLDWSVANNKKLRLKELVAITNVLADYIVDGYSATIGTRLENIQSYLDGEE
jgi:hypothetical protein